tara:strand:+ start:36 stop:653 length:618 start_codon:yes stop_codon:yes gene_type:complete
MWPGLISGGLKLLGGAGGKALGGLLGAGMQAGGYSKFGQSGQTQSQEDLESPFSKTQGLVDRMTNFSQYSAPMADMNLQAGNKSVEDSMMMGQSGSQANAIKNRLKNQNMGSMYGQYQQGLNSATQHQMGIDKQVSGQMQDQRINSQRVQRAQGNKLGLMGQSLMPQMDAFGQGGLMDSLSGGLGQAGKWMNAKFGQTPMPGGGQ